jgi:hypothetical protein
MPRSPKYPKNPRPKRRDVLAPLEHELLVYMATPYIPDSNTLPAARFERDKFVYIYPPLDLTKEGRTVAQRIYDKGYLTLVSREHRLYQLNEVGKARARESAPAWLPHPPPELQPEDIEVLRDCVQLAKVAPNAWFTPKDIGATDSSGHSFFLRRLAEHGFILIKGNHEPDDKAVTGPAAAFIPSLTRRPRVHHRYRVTRKATNYLKTLAGRASKKSLSDA